MAGNGRDDFSESKEDEKTNDFSDVSRTDQKIQNRTILAKASDADFMYKCEWNDCGHIAYSMNEFNHHLSLHRRGYTQCLGSDEKAVKGDYIFFCQWRDCHAHIEGQIDDFSRHVYYHTFHQYLKFLGRHIQTVEGLSDCLLDTSSRNVIPELPEKLMCRWHDCGMVYDNPYIFYSHVSHHCEDFPKGHDPKVKIKCLWEGCRVVTKSFYKMKEHIRSHTQAKVVACPSCGSLFASNTRFIDHLKRQSQETDQKFECSHCNNRFGSERILRDHMRHHVNHYKCPLCDMTCHSPSAVRDHVRYRHSDERSFSCHHCLYKAKTSSDLRRHSTIHEERSGFACTRPGCEKVFKQRRQLMTHYRKEHERPRHQYECHICSQTFVRGAYLTVHLREVHRYKWPSGHKRFRYKLHEDGIHRLQTIRYESIEVSQQVLGQTLSPQPHTEDKDVLDKQSVCGEESLTGDDCVNHGEDDCVSQGDGDCVSQDDGDCVSHGEDDYVNPSSIYSQGESSNSCESGLRPDKRCASPKDNRKRNSVVVDENGRGSTPKRRKGQMPLETEEDSLEPIIENCVERNESMAVQQRKVSQRNQAEAELVPKNNCVKPTSRDDEITTNSNTEFQSTVYHRFENTHSLPVETSSLQEPFASYMATNINMVDLDGKNHETMTQSDTGQRLPIDLSVSFQSNLTPTKIPPDPLDLLRSSIPASPDMSQERKTLVSNVHETPAAPFNISLNLFQTWAQSPLKAEPATDLELASTELMMKCSGKNDQPGSVDPVLKTPVKREVCSMASWPTHNDLVSKLAPASCPISTLSEPSTSTCQSRNSSLVSTSGQGLSLETVVSLDTMGTVLLQNNNSESMAVVKQESFPSDSVGICSAFSVQPSVTVTDISTTDTQRLTESVSVDVKNNVVLVADGQGGHNFHELYNLQMLGDVALNSHDSQP